MATSPCRSGRQIEGRLVRRALVYFNIQYGVNAFSDKGTHEAAYLVLQWASSAQILSWMVGNPAGYLDPNRDYTLDDPLVRDLYKPYAAEELKAIVPHVAPEISGLRGANEYVQALDINLQKALAKRISPEQAMAQTERAWNKITNRLGREQQVAAIRANRAAWPTV